MFKEVHEVGQGWVCFSFQVGERVCACVCVCTCM